MDKETLEAKAVAHIVNALQGKCGEDWNSTAEMYDGVLGWGGPLSPLTRVAFVKKFGEDFTAKMEKRARAEIAARSSFWQNSKAHQHEEQATRLMTVSPAEYSVGDFVWGVTSGLKCGESLRRELKYLIEEEAEGKARPVTIFKITRIENVEDIERDAESFLREWKAQGNEGGSMSDDLTDEEVGPYWSKFHSLPDEHRRTVYTCAILVRDTKGEYFLIDPEGYDYPRYLIAPKNWRTIFAKTVKEIEDEIKTQQMKAAAEKEKEAALAEAAYDKRCAKWEGMMEAVPEGCNEWDSEYCKVGKRNVLKMAKAAFPWVRFWVKYSRSWGRGYTLTWTNGPTENEVASATDFALFCPSRDTFDGMTECADVEQERFTDFAYKFGGIRNGVELNRQTAEKDLNCDPAKVIGKKPDKPPAPTPSPMQGGEGAHLTECVEHNGLELHFPSMPSQELRGQLVANRWRWHRIKRVWYVHATDKQRAFAERILAQFNANTEAAA